MEDHTENAAELPEVATPQETAKFVRSTTAALAQDRYLGRGLPYVKYGSRVRYLRDQVMAHLRENTVQTADPAPG